MRKIYTVLILTFTVLAAQAQFADSNLRSRLLSASPSNYIAFNQMQQPIRIDTNNDGQIDPFEANFVFRLRVGDASIQSLEGMNVFGSLRDLDCSHNSITSLAPLAYSANLGSLQCSYNQLTSASFSGLNVNELHLNSLYCNNNQIESLSTVVSSFPFIMNLDCGYNQLTTYSPLTALAQLYNLTCDGNLASSFQSLSTFTNLISLSFNSGQLTNLDAINNLLQLKYLRFNNNQIANFDLGHFPNLQTLDCSDNLLTTLYVNQASGLRLLACANNQITTLGQTNGFPNLEDLYCCGNQLTSLDISNAIFLQSLNCNGNQISTLNFPYSQLLGRIYCANNQLTTLDLSNVLSLNVLDCSDNQLQTLSIKNGTHENSDAINFSGNPGLVYICADEDQIADVQSKIIQYGYTNCHANSYCNFVPGGIFYTISGNNRFDSNGNGCDVSDLAFPNLKFTFSDGTNTGNLIADETGSYHYDVQAGTQTMTPVLENPSYFNISPATTSVTFPAASNPFTQDFCISANGVHNDLDVSLLPITAARPGFDATYKMVYKNKGTTAQSGTLNLNFDNGRIDFVSANPMVDSQIGNNLGWNFANLQPFETRTINVVLNINSSVEVPPVAGGDVLQYMASVVAGNDETPADNISDFYQTVINSFDPNDKTCLEGATITPEMVGKEIHYMIRFENTGTANAENIVIKDMIDTAKFDISSLMPIDGSHPFVTRINGNKVEFIFQNINLPFDNANNDGYVAFKIKTKPTLVLGNTFSNTASIYFDYNAPIVTNTATTTIAALAKQDFEFDRYFTIYPNPADAVLNIDSKKQIAVSSISIYNTLGQLVIVVPNAKNVATVDVSSLRSGNYFIKVISDKGTSSTKFIKN